MGKDSPILTYPDGLKAAKLPLIIRITGAGDGLLHSVQETPRTTAIYGRLNSKTAHGGPAFQPRNAITLQPALEAGANQANPGPYTTRLVGGPRP